MNGRKRLHQTAEGSHAQEEVRPEHRTSLENLGVHSATREVIVNALDGQTLTDIALVRIRSIRPSRGEDA
jgi:hypothetical protein